jgi:membrane protein DedA with SNARE-associated domain
LTAFVSTHGIWLVAAFIALESVGFPLPAEAVLMAAAIFAAQTRAFDIWTLIAAGIAAAIAGNIAGYWIGRKFGHRLLQRQGPRIGLTEERQRIGQSLFARYGGSFVFVARFLPFVRNIAAILAGANCMPAHMFYVASTAAALAWVLCYGLGSYALGEAFSALAAPVAIALAVAALLIVVGLPMLILRYEKRLLARSEVDAPRSPLGPSD